MLTLQDVTVEVRGHKMATGLSVGSSMRWQEIIVEGRPSEIQLVVSVDITGKDLIAFAVFGGKEEAMGGYRVLSVPVRWEGGIPRTRMTGVDNIDVHLLGYDGHDLDIQVGLITRKGRFFATAQQVAKGWVVRGRDGYDFVPSDPIHAYPGFSYARIWPRMGEALERVAREFGTTRQRCEVKRLAEVKRAVWRPSYLPEKHGWLRGAPLFFNMISGTGEIAGLQTLTVSSIGQVEDVQIGARYHAHFSNILDGGPVALLEPMRSIYFRPGVQERSDRMPPVKSVQLSA